MSLGQDNGATEGLLLPSRREVELSAKNRTRPEAEASIGRGSGETGDDEDVPVPSFLADRKSYSTWTEAIPGSDVRYGS